MHGEGAVLCLSIGNCGSHPICEFAFGLLQDFQRQLGTELMALTGVSQVCSIREQGAGRDHTGCTHPQPLPLCPLVATEGSSSK